MEQLLKRWQPYLLDDEKIVREFAMHALRNYPYTPEEWTAMLLENQDLKDDEFISSLLWINDKRGTGKDIPTLLQLLEDLPLHRKHLVTGALWRLPIDTIVEHKNLFSLHFPKRQLDYYCEIAGATKKELLEAFASIIEEMEQLDRYDQNLFETAKLIQDRLFQKCWLDSDDFKLIMEEELQNEWFSFRGIFTVRAIGLLKLHSYIPTVAKLLSRDEDILLEETMKALIRFQSDDVVKNVKPFAMKDSTCIFALGVLGNTKTELAETTLVECYPLLNEEGKGMVIEELSYQLSEKAFPLIEEYLQHDYFYMMSDMEQILYSFHKIMGKEHTDSDNWKALYDERQRRHEEASQNIFSYADSKIKTEPVSVQKIGRNDPCTCGSGKKFKKCCGK